MKKKKIYNCDARKCARRQRQNEVNNANVLVVPLSGVMPTDDARESSDFGSHPSAPTATAPQNAGLWAPVTAKRPRFISPAPLKSISGP